VGLAQNYAALRQEGFALRQEGYVYRVRLLRMQPSVRRAMSASRTHTVRWVTDMALLTEGGLCSGEIYKHSPPDGGRLCSGGGRTRVVVEQLRATK
jgi:hypothetical protein